MKWMMVMNLPTRKPIRLENFDYAGVGAYFITICTYKRKCIFWDSDVTAILPEHAPLSHYGRIVKQCIELIPDVYPVVTVDRYVIMPNHVHLLLQIWEHNDKSLPIPEISKIINQMKGVASKNAGISLWQARFYDHVIRNDADYRDAWNYIEGNPGKWLDDPLHIP